MRLTKTVAGLVAAAAALALGLQGGPAAATGGDHGWQQPVVLAQEGLFNTVSCTSSTFCVAIDVQSDAYVFDGQSWSGPTTVHTGQGAGGLSCVSPTFCMAVGDTGDFQTFNGTRWSKDQQIPGANGLTGVSCASQTLCFVGGEQNTLYQYGAGGWQSIQSPLQYGVIALSCISETFCMASNGYDTSIYDGQSWSTPIPVDPYQIVGLSCSSPRVCTAVDEWSRFVNYYRGYWSHRHKVERRVPRETTDVSCAAADFCVIVDNGEHAMVRDGHGYSSPERFDTSQQALHGGAAVSCPTTSFCMAVDYAGDAVEYTG